MAKWEDVDLTWLADLAAAQCPNRPAIADAIRACRTCYKKLVAYWYFVDATNANKPGVLWRFAENVMLDGGDRGQLILEGWGSGRRRVSGPDP